MTYQLPNNDTLYSALLARDETFEGRAFVGVTSTGIFCRLTCPARKPKPENCRWYDSAARCIEAGYRPCKRCHPVAPAADDDKLITDLLCALHNEPTRRWREQDILALGYDPSTVRRNFKKQFGTTFLEMARTRRMHEGFTTLVQGARVIDAQLDAGFSSASAFKTAFAKILGTSPSALQNNSELRADWIVTPLGSMVVVCDKTSLHLLDFVDRKALPSLLFRLRKSTGIEFGLGRFDSTDQVEAELADFFYGRCSDFKVKLAFHGTEFSRNVWMELRKISAGETRSYSQIAHSIGNPKAVRAVARANAANSLAIVVPCHRVIGANGSLTGYGGGLWRKQKLIELERHYSNSINTQDKEI